MAPHIEDTVPASISDGVMFDIPSGKHNILPQLPKSFDPVIRTSLMNDNQGVNVHNVPAKVTVNGSAQTNMDELQRTPAYAATRRIRIITIGAGFSGMILAHKLRYEHSYMEDLITNTIFETRSQVGGTWLVNTYPGVQCDVPSHIYAFPFDPNPDWDHFYSTGPQIQEYFVRTVKKWDLDRDVQFNTKVVGAYWQEHSGQWKVIVEHAGIRREEMADVLISGQGFLNTWKWPEIPGLDDFEGYKVHSAAWDHSFQPEGKKIAVIGNGSSGVQILPKMAEASGTQVTSFQRGPTWIVSRMDPSKLLGKPTIGANPAYTEADKREFRLSPSFHHKYRKNLIHNINKSFKMFVKDSPENLDNRDFAAKQMAEKLCHDPVLCEKLIPKWELGCRRVTPGQGYLESFLRDNVCLETRSIQGVTKTGIIVEGGEEQNFDAIICATGFDVSHCPRFPVIGRNQVSLAEKWADEPESYLSLACPDMPNYFIFTGPNAVVGHGSLVEGLGWAADYMIKWLSKMVTENIKSIEPRQEAVDDFIHYGDLIHNSLTWTGSCRSWYKKNRINGRVTATFPGSALLFRKMITDIRGEDFKIDYHGKNRFSFMGNGFTEYELSESSDLSWYVKK